MPPQERSKGQSQGCQSCFGDTTFGHQSSVCSGTLTVPRLCLQGRSESPKIRGCEGETFHLFLNALFPSASGNKNQIPVLVTLSKAISMAYSIGNVAWLQAAVLVWCLTGAVEACGSEQSFAACVTSAPTGQRLSCLGFYHLAHCQPAPAGFSTKPVECPVL